MVLRHVLTSWFAHMTYDFVLPFSVWWWGDEVTKQALRWEETKRDLKGKRLGHRMMHGKAIWNPGIAEIAKGELTGDLKHPLKPPASRANALTYVGLWPMAIKLNPSWKTEVSKSAWIKPCRGNKKLINSLKFT